MAGDARGRPGAVQTGVLTAHPESAQNGPFARQNPCLGGSPWGPPHDGPVRTRKCRKTRGSLWMGGFTRYLRRSRVFLGATEGDFIDICVVRGMFCVVSEGFYSLFTSFAIVFRSCRRRFYRYLRSSRHVLPSGWEVLLAVYVVRGCF